MLIGPQKLKTKSLTDEELEAICRDNPELGTFPGDYCPTCRKSGTYRYNGVEHACNCREQRCLHKHYLAAGIGLAWTFQWYTALLFFVGAVIGYVFEKVSPEKSEEYTFPVASGLIAGGSLMAVFVIFCENGPQMVKQLFGG